MPTSKVRRWLFHRKSHELWVINTSDGPTVAANTNGIYGRLQHHYWDIEEVKVLKLKVEEYIRDMQLMIKLIYTFKIYIYYRMEENGIGH